METLDLDVQHHERLSSQACENVLREQHLLRAWHRAVLQSNSQQNNNNNNNNNNSKKLLPNYGKMAGKEGGAIDQYARRITDRYYALL
jgi:phosphoribosylanthranilate isomerase